MSFLSRHSSVWWMIMSALAVIVPVAAVGSYLQALIVVQAADGHTTVSWFVAGLADPTIFAASANIADSYRSTRKLPPWSCVSLGLALVVTGGANVLAGSPHDLPAWLVRLWPAVAFLMALESLLSFLRRTQPLRHSRTDDDPERRCPHEIAMSASEATVTAYLHARDCIGKPNYRETARQFGLHHDKVRQMVTTAESLAVPSANGTAPHE